MKPTIQVQRDALDNAAANKVAGRVEYQDKSLLEYIPSSVKTRPKSWKKFFNRYLPLTDWLFNYHFKSDFSHDIVSGFTVAIMHISQGMAYAKLAETEPMVGIYTAVFPVFMYTIFGPSRHVSIGTNSLTSILVGTAVTKNTLPEHFNATSTNSRGFSFRHFWESRSSESDPYDGIDPDIDSLDVVVTLALLTGLWQLLFALFGLGKLSWIMSDVLVSGYTTGAAIHVIASQLKGLFGVDLDSHDGPLKIWLIIAELIERREEINGVCVIISAISITVLVFNDEVLKPHVKKKCSFPIPIMLIVVVTGILVSYYCELNAIYDVPIIDDVPKGFQVSAPKASLFGDLIVSSLVIAIVSYSITLSMAKIFAIRFNYRIDGNQEMLGVSVGNIFGCFFSCLPAAASMSRSSVQVAVGGKTQFASIVSMCILIIVILFAGPLFEPLPNAILSSIIIAALKGMLWQYKDLPVFYRRSKLDALLWVATFTAIILLEVDSGLGLGIIFNIMLLVYRGYNAKIEEVAPIRDTGLIGEVGDCEFAVRPQQAPVIRIEGQFSYANFDSILTQLAKKIKHLPEHDKKMVILDFSRVPFIDQSACKGLKSWIKNLKDTKIIFAGPKPSIVHMMGKFEMDTSVVFPSVLDALKLANLVDKESEDIEGQSQQSGYATYTKEEEATGHENSAYADNEDEGIGSEYKSSSGESEEGGGNKKHSEAE